MRHRASWPPPQGLPVQDKLSLPQRPASHPSVMTRPSAAPSVSLVATPGLTENLRETGICLGRQKAQVGGAGCQPCQYDEDAPRGHEPTDGRQRLYPGIAPVHRTREEPGSVQERRERPRGGGEKIAAPRRVGDFLPGFSQVRLFPPHPSTTRGWHPRV